MLECVLPDELICALKKLNVEWIYEIRIRDNKTVKVNYNGRYVSLIDAGRALIAEEGTCAKIVTKACDYSLYSVNNQIIQGYITVEKGARIGLCGEIVRENDGIKTVKNFNSLNIRIPHDVVNCANELFGYIYTSENIADTIIVSPPGKGKTTMLRDLARKLSAKNVNVLIVDERNEICAVNSGKAYYDTGENCDVITYGSKEFAFSYGIRTMAPDVVITDELMTQEDAESVLLAMASGVKVVASAHAYSAEDFKTKHYLKTLVSSRAVDRYVFLSSKTQGKIAAVYDANFGRIK